MKRLWSAIGILAGLAFLLVAPPITQDQEYHLFADRRIIGGIPNFWNVASNLAFAVACAAGWFMVRGRAAHVLALGVFLTCFGSVYYHLEPSDARLVWDRLPMAIVFMSLVAILLDQRLLAPLVALGIASVWWWYRTGNRADQEKRTSADCGRYSRCMLSRRSQKASMGRFTPSSL